MDCWACSPSLGSWPVWVGASPVKLASIWLLTVQARVQGNLGTRLSVGGKKGLLGNKLPRPSLPPSWGVGWGPQREEQKVGKAIGFYMTAGWGSLS